MSDETVTDLQAQAQVASEAAVKASDAVKAAQEQFMDATQASIAAQKKVIEAKRAEKQQIAADLREKAEALKAPWEQAQAAYFDALNAAAQAESEARGGGQVCPFCNTFINQEFKEGQMVNCPKCDRNFPAV